MTRCTSYNTLIIIGFDERIAFYVVAVVVFVSFVAVFTNVICIYIVFHY